MIIILGLVFFPSCISLASEREWGQRERGRQRETVNKNKRELPEEIVKFQIMN